MPLRKDELLNNWLLHVWDVSGMYSAKRPSISAALTTGLQPQAGDVRGVHGHRGGIPVDLRRALDRGAVDRVGINLDDTSRCPLGLSAGSRPVPDQSGARSARQQAFTR